MSAAKPLAVLHNWCCDTRFIFLFTLSSQNAQAFIQNKSENVRDIKSPSLVRFSYSYLVYWRYIIVPLYSLHTISRCTNCDSDRYLILVDHNNCNGGLGHDQLSDRLLQFHGVDILRKCHVSVASDALHETRRAETI